MGGGETDEGGVSLSSRLMLLLETCLDGRVDGMLSVGTTNTQF